MDQNLCACGCGTAIGPKVQTALGHHWRVKRVAQRVPTEKVCERCGKTYRREDLLSPQSNKYWLKRRFCGDSCRRAARGESSRKQRGEDHPGWKGDAATAAAGNQRARRMYPDRKPCQVCGAGRADRHHVDGNTLNNSRENIAWLCRKHHIRAEDRMAYKRRPMTAERLERKRVQARERQRRYRERQRQRNARTSN